MNIRVCYEPDKRRSRGEIETINSTEGARSGGHVLKNDGRVSIVRCPKRRASETKLKRQRVEPPTRGGGHVLTCEERILIVRCPKRSASEKKVKNQRVKNHPAKRRPCAEKARAHLDRILPKAAREREGGEKSARGTTPQRGDHVLKTHETRTCAVQNRERVRIKVNISAWNQPA
jgi:hypothetical protein